MRFLLVSNLFPPAFIGGYEIGASWVAQELRNLGHKVQVLTAREVFLGKGDRCERLVHAGPPPAADGLIDAGLCFYGVDVLDGLLLGRSGESYTQAREALERHLSRFAERRRERARAVIEFSPDAILVFNPACILDPVLAELKDMPMLRHVPMIGFVSDDWRLAWERSNPLIFLRKFFEANKAHPAPHLSSEQVRLLERCRSWEEAGVFRFQETPRIDHVFYCSAYLQGRYVRELPTLPTGLVLPWGLPGIAEYPEVKPDLFASDEPLTLAYSGQLEPHKGLYDLLQALLLCRKPHRLVVCGDANTLYAKFCQSFVESSELAGRVTFLGRLPPEEVWGALSRHAAVFVLPSRIVTGQFQEPFSIGLLQAMASGFAVIASTSGGSPEAIAPRRTGLLFTANEPGDLAAQIDALETDRSVARGYAEAARREAQARYGITTMARALLAPALEGARKGSPVAVPATRPLPRARCSLFYLVHNANRDPANSGCVRVARRLAHELQFEARPWFVRWLAPKNAITFLTDSDAEYLSRFNGPDAADSVEPGQQYGAEQPIHEVPAVASQLKGAWLILPELLDGEMLTAILAYARTYRMRVMSIFYDAIPLLRPELCSDEIRSNHARYMDLLARSDLVVPISRFSSECLVQHWRDRGVTPCTVVPVLLPGEFKGVAPAEADPSAEVIEMLCVSTLEPRKNHATLLAACEYLAQHAPQLKWRLHLVGNSYAGADEIRINVEATSRRDPRIIWHRIVDDKALGDLYQRAAFTVYPSVIEGYGLPIVESAWYGRPCICSDGGVMAELGADGGCVLVNVENAAALGEAMLRLATDGPHRVRLAAQAAQRIIKTWRRYGLEILSTLRAESEIAAVAQVRRPKRLLPIEHVLYLGAGPRVIGPSLSNAERLALSTLLRNTKPKVALEVATKGQRSSSALRHAVPVLFHLSDADVPAHDDDVALNVSHIHAPVREALPVLLSELALAQMPLDMIFLDGDESGVAAVAESITCILKEPPQDLLYLLIRGSFNPACRARLLDVPWADSPYVHSVEIDFVPGGVIDRPGTARDGHLGGGLALAVLHPQIRSNSLLVSQAAAKIFEKCRS